MKTIALLPILFVAFVGASADIPLKKNRVFYGNIQTGLKFRQFETIAPGFKEVATGLFTELEEKSSSDYSIQVKRPENLDLFDTYVKRIPSVLLRPEKTNRCDSPQGALFLKKPADRKAREVLLLYSYEYLICAGEGKVSPERVYEKYVEKYGNRDKKDYDRNQNIYLNVHGRYEVRVKPITSEEKIGGLLITVADSEVFQNVYASWRAHIRELEAKVKEKL